MHNILRNGFVLAILLIFIGCGKSTVEQKNNSAETIKIEAVPSIINLYYSDFIKPIRTISVRNTEADGIIIEKYFEYGENLKKNQLLFVISSQQLSKNYYDALRQYVKSADSLATAEYQMEGAEYLKKLQILSQQEYNSTKSQLFSAKLDYADSSTRLYTMMQQEGMDVAILEKVKSKDPRTIYNTLSTLPKTNVFEVSAPVAGIALLPASEGKESSAAPLNLGSQVKASQELLEIGDMTGISITVRPAETNIDKIKVGQRAIVTGDAFPGISLEGKVVAVGRQASTGGSSSMPSFNVTVNVTKVTQEALNKIRVGMSADVAFPIESPPIIKIPLTAVFKKDNQAFVKKINPTTGEIISAPVVTGRTELDSIEITQGLKDKDEVVVNASSD